MSTASTDQPPPQEPAARLQNIASPRPSMPEHLPCPRCDSPNTKFCYYNNYNLSQPRYFCKSCRRYWTRGGTLRNVPVGGGSRKSSANKRFRSTPSATGTPTAAAATITSSSSSSTLTFNDLSPPKPAVVKAENGYGPSPCRGGVNLNEVAVGDFGSLLTSQQQGDGFVQMANFGFGFGFGLGSGFGTWDWPAEQVEEADVGGGENVSGGGVATGCNTWQLACVESGLPEGDRYGWPDLAISAPGKSLE